MSAPIRLESLDAEAEADALLMEDDLERSGTGDDIPTSLEELEATESLPPPVQAIAAVSCPPRPGLPGSSLGLRAPARGVGLLTTCPSPRRRSAGTTQDASRTDHWHLDIAQLLGDRDERVE